MRRSRKTPERNPIEYAFAAAHEQALEAEGDRIALCFAELGWIPEMRSEP